MLVRETLALPGQLLALLARPLQCLELGAEAQEEPARVTEGGGLDARPSERLLESPRVALAFVDLPFELCDLVLQARELDARALPRHLSPPEAVPGVAFRLLGPTDGRIVVTDRGTRKARDGFHGLRADRTGLPRLQVPSQLVGQIGRASCRERVFRTV